MSDERRRQAKAKRRRNRKSSKPREEPQFRMVHADATGALTTEFSGNFGPDNPLTVATYNMGSPVYGDGSNPGSGAICDGCNEAFYIDNMLPSVTALTGSDAPVEHTIGPCPQCGGLGTAVMYTVESEFGRTVATHPAGVLVALHITQSLVEAGKLDPEEALDRLRDLRPLAPLLEWIDDNTDRLGLLIGALGLVIAGFQTLESDGVTDRQIEQIVRSVVTELSEAPTEPAPVNPISQKQSPSIPKITFPG
jgi:hypothetical protein